MVQCNKRNKTREVFFSQQQKTKNIAYACPHSVHCTFSSQTNVEGVAMRQRTSHQKCFIPAAAIHSHHCIAFQRRDILQRDVWILAAAVWKRQGHSAYLLAGMFAGKKKKKKRLTGTDKSHRNMMENPNAWRTSSKLPPLS